MIQNKDRSGYIGASDTRFVVGNWNTKTFAKWWLEKLGLTKNNFSNQYTIAGTHYEHKILDSLKIKNIVKDRQVIIGRLRVNFDGSTPRINYEVKTYKYENGFKLYRSYIEQVQVQMYADKKKKTKIVAYGLTSKDYKNFFNKIDKKRINIEEIYYDKHFIEDIYLPRFKYLERCLIKKQFPNYEEFLKESED